MLLVIRPVPGSLEQLLTINMQKVASTLAGNILNIMGVLHYKQGVVLKLVGQSFMAEEACSGVRSLFSSITAIVFLGLMNRYHWSRHLFNVMQTIMWVVVLNAFRIAVVVYV
jgi:exosortase